ncbi:hypothetical protein MKW94_010937 [Papaver nudicaule]|uniref:Peptidase metallopeptidase domain-containing protein n=1 Tax=Papaver nudicaule TaxID=74823 RepID=A0AA41S515_PAPNU|nr:hypothetical protein [Papaver nudicaule]
MKSHIQPCFPHVAFLILFLLAVLPNRVLSRKELQPVLSLKHLEGCRKGKTVKGLHEVKSYLKRFGYANVVANINDYRRDDDTFDDVLESEIKAYQLNQNLDVTGKLDTRTLEQMMLPRCGVPDIDENGESSMRWKQYGPNFNFYSRKKHWPPSKYNLTYKFTSDGSAPSKIDDQTLRDVCARAFAAWAGVTHFQFREAAHAFAPTDGRLHYDADENWGTGQASDETDLESVTVHEIGHILGLRHTSDEQAVMFPTIGQGVVKRQLGSDDIKGVQTLYA